MQDTRSASERFVAQLPERVLRKGQVCGAAQPVEQWGRPSGQAGQAGQRLGGWSDGMEGEGVDGVRLILPQIA